MKCIYITISHNVGLHAFTPKLPTGCFRQLDPYPGEPQGKYWVYHNRSDNNTAQMVMSLCGWNGAVCFQTPLSACMDEAITPKTQYLKVLADNLYSEVGKSEASITVSLSYHCMQLTRLLYMAYIVYTICILGACTIVKHTRSTNNHPHNYIYATQICCLEIFSAG